MVTSGTPFDFVFLIGSPATAKVSSFGHIPADFLLLRWLFFLMNTCPGGLLDFTPNVYHHWDTFILIMTKRRSLIRYLPTWVTRTGMMRYGRRELSKSSAFIGLF